MSSAVGGQDMDRSFVRSAVVLTVCIFATAALLLPVAIREPGTGNLARFGIRHLDVPGVVLAFRSR